MPTRPLLFIGALAFVVGCAGRALLSDNRSACYEEGLNDVFTTWCQYGATLVPPRDIGPAIQLGVSIPAPEGGCGACDGNVGDELMEGPILEFCGDGPVEWERGCWDEPVFDPDSGECMYYAFA